MSGREPMRVHPLAALLIFLGVGGLCASVGLAVNGYGDALTKALFLISFVPFGAGQVYNHHKRQRDWFYRRFRTYENFRAEAIEEARQVRHEKGNAGVVRHLKILYPHLPTTMVTRLIKEL
ncbi:hypothetical protein [Streptomyces tubercidicus]|uniref:hypothetical protein n=1 Tax=Streptomyces tubercidicus TaxID=47759 RepID=UPI003688450F